MSDDIYKTPESSLLQEVHEKNIFASRWQRLWASLLDGLIIGLITFPLMYFTGGFDGVSNGTQPSLGYTLFLGVLGIAVFFAFNVKLLLRDGQTIGKKVVGIKIVDLNDNVPVIKNLLVRYITYFIPGQVPLVGQLFSMVNILFIFGKQKRCIHDYFAGTRVVIN